MVIDHMILKRQFDMRWQGRLEMTASAENNPIRMPSAIINETACISKRPTKAEEPKWQSIKDTILSDKFCCDNNDYLLIHDPFEDCFRLGTEVCQRGGKTQRQPG